MKPKEGELLPERERILVDRMGVPSSWTPGFGEALRFSWKPILAFFLFVATGSASFAATILYYEKGELGKTLLSIAVILGTGLLGVLAGQFLALLRLRLLVFNIAFYLAGQLLMLVLMLIFGAAFMAGSGELGVLLVLGLVCFAFGLPCGIMSLHHRFELLATLWPAIGWIGSVFTIINEEGRAAAWEQNKLSAWMPVPLAMLACFIFFLLVFLASKQTMRVEIWQALSGSPARRHAEAAQMGAVPKRNLRWLVVSAAVLFALTAVLSPYLFRTGKGERESHKNGAQHHGDDDASGSGKGKGKKGYGQGDDDEGEGRSGKQKRGPQFSEESLKQIAEQMKNAAKKAVWALIPLLLLAIFFRPLKRLVLVSYLRAPWLPTTPSERVDNLWEYLRIKIEDTGADLTGSDAALEVLAKTKDSVGDLPELSEAAQIYMRARYDLVLAPNDSSRMREVAFVAAKALHRTLSLKTRITIHWRSLG